ncbi:hypothetical protein BJY01DRAFT_216222 [Aspergillus pseudoustus]|uniref:C2H2 type master regulator of conidiophore development brlA n=1 Tax=Aspergillus pseudoustus TaxID=1810923 RepID=A0ABR4JV01_9EURO
MRVFRCSWPACDKEFVRKADLARHFQIHVDERPYVCPEPGCSKRFHQRSSLSIHQRIHTGERPYLCEVDGCQRSFSDPSSYSRHQRSHKNDKPYVCGLPYCRQKFSRKSTLEQHRLQHEAQDIVAEQQRRQHRTTQPPVNSNPTPTVPPAAPSSPTFDAFDWDAVPCDNIDTLLERLTQPPPNPNIAPFPATPSRSPTSPIQYIAQQYVDLSSLGHVPVQPPSHDWPFPPAAPRPVRSFPSFYIDDSSIAYSDDELLSWRDRVP